MIDSDRVIGDFEIIAENFTKGLPECGRNAAPEIFDKVISRIVCLPVYQLHQDFPLRKCKFHQLIFELSTHFFFNPVELFFPFAVVFNTVEVLVVFVHFVADEFGIGIHALDVADHFGKLNDLNL
ncbi:hypothetical protein DSECCO2_655160 [anaerobic digester metagenome]